MSTVAVCIVIAALLVAGVGWIWFEAWRVTRPEYDDYNARQDAAGRWCEARPEPAPTRPADAAAQPAAGVDDRADTVPA